MVKDENGSGKQTATRPQNTSTYGHLRYGGLPRYADLPTLVMCVFGPVIAHGPRMGSPNTHATQSCSLPSPQ
jgi:hypothetical protein